MSRSPSGIFLIRGPLMALCAAFCIVLCTVTAPVEAADNKKKALETEAANVYKQINGKPKIFKNSEISPEMMSAMDEMIRHEAKSLGGSEYAPQREVGSGKLTCCASDCYVVTYLLEGVPQRGSNNNIQYMAVYIYNLAKPMLVASCQVGGRGMRYVTLKSIGPEVITCNTEFYKPKDPMSSPSGKGHTNFVLAGRHLIETP